MPHPLLFDHAPCTGPVGIHPSSWRRPGLLPFPSWVGCRGVSFLLQTELSLPGLGSAPAQIKGRAACLPAFSWGPSPLEAQFAGPGLTGAALLGIQIFHLHTYSSKNNHRHLKIMLHFMGVFFFFHTLGLRTQKPHGTSTGHPAPLMLLHGLGPESLTPGSSLLLLSRK